MPRLGEGDIHIEVLCEREKLDCVATCWGIAHDGQSRMQAINDMIKRAVEAFQQGRNEQADEFCAQVLSALPAHYGALHLRGLVAQKQGRLDQAIEWMQESIRLAPRIGEYHNNLGEALSASGKLDEAIAAYRKGIELSPRSPEAYSNLGNALRAQGKPDEAIGMYQKAIAIQPSLAVAHHNLGEVLQELRRLDEAVVAYQNAIVHRPEYVKPMVGLGAALLGLGKPREAVDWYRKAIALDPSNPEAHWNLGLVLIELGEWEEGWQLYEWRWRTNELPPRQFDRPLWEGQELHGKTILVHPEQGLGDTIHFIRYARLLAERGGRVVFESQKPLAKLLTTVEGISQIITSGDPLPEFDYHIPLLSLPNRFGTRVETTPAKVPYIFVPAGHRTEFPGWEEARNKKKIGLVWKVSTVKGSTQERTISLSELAPLFELEDVAYFSLQGGEGKAQLAGSGLPIVDWGFDFVDTAAAILKLDLVISVDTSIAHLAGALGAKVWTLQPFARDWRWLHGHEDTPWYPTMRLFQQKRVGDWAEVIQRVISELRKSL